MDKLKSTLEAIDREVTRSKNRRTQSPWIRCEDRLPTEADADFDGNVIWWENPYVDLRPEAWGPVVAHWDPQQWPESCPSDLMNIMENHSHWKPTGLERPQPPEV